MASRFNVSLRQKAEIVALEVEVAPRRLTTDQQAAIANELTPFAGKTVALSSYVLDVESAVLLFQIKDILEKARIVTNP